MEASLMITGFQLIAIVFSLVMIYLAYLNHQRKEIGKIEFISWWVVWAGTIIIVIFPDLLKTFTSTFLITRVFDFMVIGGFILVITLAYQAYIKVRRLEQKISKLIRTQALKEANEKN